jgi:hypothetical protein
LTLRIFNITGWRLTGGINMSKGKFPLYSQIIIVALVAGYFIFAEFAPSAASASNNAEIAGPQPAPTTPPRIRPPPPPHHRPPTNWTSEGVVFQPEFNPTAQTMVSGEVGHIEWDCAHADFETVTADGQGGFVGTGTYTSEHGGPIHQGEDNSTRALFVGVVKGDQLTLNITTYLKSTSQATLNLNHNVSNRRPFKCL